MQSGVEQNRGNLDWWPAFAREMFAEIGVVLDGKTLDPARAYDIKAPWPDHRIEIVYVSREEFAAERMEEPEGKYLFHILGKQYGGARWEFRQNEIDLLDRTSVAKPPIPRGLSARQRAAAPAPLDIVPRGPDKPHAFCTGKIRNVRSRQDHRCRLRGAQ